MARGPSKQEFCPSAQQQYASTKHLNVVKSKRGRNSGVRVAQIISLQMFIKSAMFSSEYTDFFGLAAPAAGQTISRTCLKAMFRFHTMFHATPKAYLDEWEAPVASLCLQPSEATSIITRPDDADFVDAINMIGFLGRTEILSQKMTYPDFLWDHKCYHAYFMATLTNLRAQWRQRHSKPIPRRCFKYDSTEVGDVMVGMAIPNLGLHQAGYMTGVVQAKAHFGLREFYICCPWKIGFGIGCTAAAPQDTQVQHGPEVWMPRASSTHHNLTCLARHIWSAGMIQRSWKRYLQKSSQKCISMRNAAVEQELFTITLHPSRLVQHVDMDTARRINLG
ncbi:TPA: hypothetical protein ACH3X1_012471 [Trebouxia sp. C0004]